MSAALRLLSAPSDVAAAVRASLAWCDEFELCTPSVDSRLGRWDLWRDLIGSGRKLRRAFVAADGLRTEPHALEELHRLGVLRLVPAADGSFRAHVFRFRRAGMVRTLAGCGALHPDGLMAPVTAMTMWEGPELAEFALETDRVFARAKRVAHIPEFDELRRYATLHLKAAAHRAYLEELGAPLIRRSTSDGESLDLELVHRGRDVRPAMATVQEQLRDVATATRRSGGAQSGERIYWSAPLGMWSFFRRLDNRYLNCFGVQHPEHVRSLQATVEVNPPVEGIDRKMGGAIAREASTGRRFLVHRGRIGGGLDRDLFWSCFRSTVTMREPDRDRRGRAVVVGEIGSDSFTRDVAAFVHEVRRIKTAAATNSPS